MKYCICNNFFLSFQLEEELLEYKSIAEKTCEVCSRMNTRHRVALSSAGETGEHSLVAVNVVWISHWMISTEVEKGIIFCSNKGLYSGSIRAVSHFLLSIGLVLSILIDLFFIPFWPFCTVQVVLDITLTLCFYCWTYCLSILMEMRKTHHHSPLLTRQFIFAGKCCTKRRTGRKGWR